MNVKKLTIVAFYKTNYPNDSSPMSSRLHLYMKALSNAGADVQIIVPTNENKEGVIIDGIKYSYELIENLDKNSPKSNHVIYINIIKRLAKKFDVVFTSLADDNYIKHYSHAVKEVGGKIVFEMNENPHSIVASRKDFKIILSIKRWYFMNFVANKIDGFIVISRSLENLFNKHVKDKSKIIRIPILIENKINLNINRFNLNESFIFHAGSLSEQKDGIKSIMKAFNKARLQLNNKLKFYLTQNNGFPSLLKWINNFITVNQLEENVKFTGLLERFELNQYYEKCSLAIINKPINEQNLYNFSTKLTELIPRGIPLIISKTGEHNHYFKHDYNCFMVEPDNVDEIAEGIVKIIKNAEYSNFITQNALKLIDSDFNYLNYSNDLFNYFLNIKMNGHNK